jgi:hypothetical protein
MKNRKKTSEELRTLVVRAVRPWKGVARDFVLSSDLERIFPEYLYSTYCVARATVPLLQTALDISRKLSRRDRVARALLAYLANHLREEQHHAQWLLEDLSALGVRSAALHQRVPPPWIAAGVGTQYYLVNHGHPIALFGYMSVLEGTMIDTETAEFLVRRSGLPRKGFRTLLEHARLDSDHANELSEVLDSVPLADVHRGLLRTSVYATIEMLGRTFREFGKSQRTVAHRRAAPRMATSASRHTREQ